jgi:hypothetical protein
MPPVFAITAISRESFVSVLVTHQAHTLREKVATTRVHWTLAARKSSSAHHQAEHRHKWLIRQLALK